MSQEPDTAPGPYYVTACDDSGDYWTISGPYDTHQKALENVEQARYECEARDPRAAWMSFGTSRLKDSTGDWPRPILQARLALPLDLNSNPTKATPGRSLPLGARR